jgi:hypothetical protein
MLVGNDTDETLPPNCTPSGAHLGPTAEARTVSLGPGSTDHRGTVSVFVIARVVRSIRTPEIYERKADAVFEHVYDCYYGAGKSIYTAAA